MVYELFFKSCLMYISQSETVMSTLTVVLNAYFKYRNLSVQKNLFLKSICGCAFSHVSDQPFTAAFQNRCHIVSVIFTYSYEWKTDQTPQIAQGQWSLGGPFCKKFPNTEPEPVLLRVSLVGSSCDGKHTLVYCRGGTHVLWWRNASLWLIHLIIYSQKPQLWMLQKHC